MQQFVRGLRYLIEGAGPGLFILYASCAALATYFLFVWLGVVAMLAYSGLVTWAVYDLGEVPPEPTGNEIDADYDPLRRK